MGYIILCFIKKLYSEKSPSSVSENILRIHSKTKVYFKDSQYVFIVICMIIGDAVIQFMRKCLKFPRILAMSYAAGV